MRPPRAAAAGSRRRPNRSAAGLRRHRWPPARCPCTAPSAVHDLGLHEIVECELGDARHRGGVELAGLGARELDELGDGLDLHRRRHADAEDGGGEARHRHEVGRIVGSFLYWNGCTVKLPLGPHRKVWSSLAESTAWIAMMLSPPGRFSITTGWPQLFCSRSWMQPRADVGAGARSERNDEAHRPLRPALRLRLRLRASRTRHSEQRGDGRNPARASDMFMHILRLRILWPGR